MLDAYIIDRIRREQDEAQRIDPRTPLRIEPPRPRGHGTEERENEPTEPGDERGTAVIDFTL